MRRPTTSGRRTSDHRRDHRCRHAAAHTLDRQQALVETPVASPSEPMHKLHRLKTGGQLGWVVQAPAAEEVPGHAVDSERALPGRALDAEALADGVGPHEALDNCQPKW